MLRPLVQLHRHPAQPVTPLLLPALAGAEIVHAHHVRSVPTRMAAVTARAPGVGTAVTDHGLPGRTWGGLVHRLFDRFLTVSRFSADVLGATPVRTRVIYGGADPSGFAPRPGTDRDGVLFVGRLTPHKGIDRLLRSLPAGAACGSPPVAATTPSPGARLPGPAPPAGQRPGRRLPGAGARPGPARPVPHGRRPGPPVGRPHLLRPEGPHLRSYSASPPWRPCQRDLGVASRIGGLAEVVDGETEVPGRAGRPGRPPGPARPGPRRPRPSRRLGANARDLVVQQVIWRACAERCLTAY